MTDGANLGDNSLKKTYLGEASRLWILINVMLIALYVHNDGQHR